MADFPFLRPIAPGLLPLLQQQQRQNYLGPLRAAETLGHGITSGVSPLSDALSQIAKAQYGERVRTDEQGFRAGETEKSRAHDIDLLKRREGAETMRRAAGRLADIPAQLYKVWQEQREFGLKTEEAESRIQERKARIEQKAARNKQLKTEGNARIEQGNARIAALKDAKDETSRRQAESDAVDYLKSLDIRLSEQYKQLADARLFDPELADAIQMRIDSITEAQARFTPVLTRMLGRAMGTLPPPGAAAPEGTETGMAAPVRRRVEIAGSGFETAVPDKELMALLLGIKRQAEASGLPIETVASDWVEALVESGVGSMFPSRAAFQGSDEDFLGHLSPWALQAHGADASASMRRTALMWADLAKRTERPIRIKSVGGS